VSAVGVLCVCCRCAVGVLCVCCRCAVGVLCECCRSAVCVLCIVLCALCAFVRWATVRLSIQGITFRATLSWYSLKTGIVSDLFFSRLSFMY
jgi:hypothetical protein